MVVPLKSKLLLLPQVRHIFNVIPMRRKELVEPPEFMFVEMLFDQNANLTLDLSLGHNEMIS
jgi:hypothetical protein